MNPDMMKKVLAFCRAQGMSDTDLTALMTMLEGAAADDEPDPMTRGGAMDSRMAFDAATMIGSGSPVRVMQALRMAEAEVAPVVGEVLGMDSAADVYRTALKRLGHDTAALHPTAMQVMYRSLRGRGVQANTGNTARFHRDFPDAARIRVV